MRFILIGNYPPDGQESMKKYTQNLCEHLIKNDVAAEIWYPKVFFAAASSNTIAGIGKWLGYLDKWILFPLILKLRILFVSDYGKKDVFFHVCDHSNSPYLNSLPKARSGITCHDVLAIRGALGYEDAYCPASSMGKILQQWILGNLKKARILTTVSQLTMDQLLDLCKNDHLPEHKWKVIHNSFNANFWPMKEEENAKIVARAGIPAGTPFILHVGSGLPRKNREMLLKLSAQLGEQWKGLICFAGEPLTESLTALAVKLGLTERMIAIVKPDHETLVALYSACTAFVFPSYSEGFGWPLIEAQACAAPVIASNVAPMPEVTGGMALHAAPDDVEGFAQALLEILDSRTRAQLVLSGLANAKRFDSDLLTKKFITLYAN